MKASRLLVILSQVFFVLSVALLGYLIHLVFMVVPNEAQMGPVQRIFYFHVGAATACYSALAVLLIASLNFLASRGPMSDIVGAAAAEVAFLFASIVLASGMIWGHSAWNTWFSWEPRLVSFLILWLMLLAYMVQRNFGDQTRTASHSAVLGIISAINVPIVVYSMKLLPHLAQLHPQVVESEGLRDPLFKSTMFWGLGALMSFMVLLLCLRIRAGILEYELLKEK